MTFPTAIQSSQSLRGCGYSSSTTVPYSLSYFKPLGGHSLRYWVSMNRNSLLSSPRRPLVRLSIFIHTYTGSSPMDTGRMAASPDSQRPTSQNLHKLSLNES